MVHFNLVGWFFCFCCCLLFGFLMACILTKNISEFQLRGFLPLKSTWLPLKETACLALVIFSPACGKLGFRDSEWCTHFISCPVAAWKQENEQTKETKGEEENSHGVGNCDWFYKCSKFYLVAFLIVFFLIEDVKRQSVWLIHKYVDCF